MIKMVLPLILALIGATGYNICTKATNAESNSFLSLTVSYLVAAVFSFIFYLVSTKASLLVELKKVNGASIWLGLAIVAMETGYIWLYRVGWKISLGSLMVNILLAVILTVVGVLLYKEAIAMKQLIGMAVCIAGIILINL